MSHRKLIKTENVPAVNQPPLAVYENIEPLPQSSTETKKCPAMYENIEPYPQSSIEMKKCPAVYENIEPFSPSSIEMKECPAYGVV